MRRGGQTEDVRDRIHGFMYTAEEDTLSVGNANSNTFLNCPFTLEIIYFQFVATCVLARALKGGARSVPEGC